MKKEINKQPNIHTMTKAEIIDSILANVKSATQRKQLKKQAMRKKKDYLDWVYTSWLADKEHEKFYVQLIIS